MGISQIVQVVSMEDVMISDGWTTFQSREVIGAVCSGDFEFERRASGESFWSGWSLGRVIELDDCDGCSVGKDHNRR